MQTIQINGTFTYIDNIKQLKKGDIIKLKENPNNRLNKDAVGAYTLNDLKIGYIPFTLNQVNIKSKYIVEKIYPILLISREYENSNIIELFNKNQQDINNKMQNELLLQDIKAFKISLERMGYIIKDIQITYNDENFIDILIKTDTNVMPFYTVTKKYYDKNIFIYDDFYKLKLIPKCIYEPFKIHRLNIYIEQKYKLLSKTKLIMPDINNFEKIIMPKNIQKENIINNLEFKNLIPDLQIGGICYNHEYKSYCYIDLYNIDSLLEISNKCLDKIYYNELLSKLIQSNRNTMYLYNSQEGLILKIELTEIIKNKFNEFKKIN